MSNKEVKLTIRETWDGQIPLNNVEIHIKLSKSTETKDVIIQVDAPFYNDPQVPSNIPTGSMNQLWDYEVVEIFFLGENDKYLEVELSPRGHYLLLQLEGCRNIVKQSLPLEHFKTRITEAGRWIGEAIIPFQYFPFMVNKLNAYAIHKSDPNRIYMSLFPTPSGKFQYPDFHRLEYFQTVPDLNKIFNAN